MEEGERLKLAFIQDMVVSEFDTAHEEQSYLLETHGRSFQVSRNVYDLIRAHQLHPGNLVAVAKAYSADRTIQYGPQEIKALTEKFILPFAKVEEAFPEKKSPLSVSYDLLSESSLLPITNVLKHLFYRPLLISVLLISLVVQFFFLIQYDVNDLFLQNWETPVFLVYKWTSDCPSLFFP